MSILLRNCSIIERGEKADILVRGGRIEKIASRIRERAEEEIDAEGNIVMPSFVEPHVHMDKAFLAERMARAKSMAEARSMVRAAKKEFSKDDVRNRAERCIKLALLNGVTYVRTHVDIDSIAGLKSFEAISELKKKYENYLTLQIVAFPQEGIFKDESAYELICKALDRGAEVIGGLPEAEVDKEKGEKQIQKLAALAKERDVPLDMHIDVQPYTNYVEQFVINVKRFGLKGRATADHLIALAYYDDFYASKIINMLRDEKINVVSNPCTMMVSGSNGPPPVARGVTRIKELLSAGVNIAFGLDNIVDPYNPFGDFDPIRNAWLFAYAGQLSSDEEINSLLLMPTYNSSRILGLRNYGIAEGRDADINIIPSSNATEALRSGARPIYVIRNGRVIVKRRCEVSSFYQS